MEIRKFEKQDVPALMRIWNEVVDAGQAFPQEDDLTPESAEEFFSSQSFTGAAVENGEVVGLYILHPNNVGRQLVTDCLHKCRELGFRVMQFNAVVADNAPALALYKSLGFVRLGVIPGGFRKKDGTYADIIPHYFDVTKL